MIIRLIVGMVKKKLYKMSQCFPKPYKCFGGNVKIELDLAIYATKADVKEATRVDMSNLAAKYDLSSMKVNIDKIDVDKLKNVPVDLNKLKNVVKNKVVKKETIKCMLN